MLIKSMDKVFDVVVTQDETGGYIAFVPGLPGCHTQADNLDELRKNIKEAVELYLETLSEAEKRELRYQPEFVGIQRIKTRV